MHRFVVFIRINNFFSAQAELPSFAQSFLVEYIYLHNIQVLFRNFLQYNILKQGDMHKSNFSFFT